MMIVEAVVMDRDPRKQLKSSSLRHTENILQQRTFPLLLYLHTTMHTPSPSLRPREIGVLFSISTHSPRVLWIQSPLMPPMAVGVRYPWDSKCGEWMYRFVQASLCRSVYRRSLWALVTVQLCAVSMGMKASVWEQAYKAYWAKRKWQWLPNQSDMVKIHHDPEISSLQSFSSFYCCGWCHTMLPLRDCNKG